jgi:hypothetical protein
MLFCSCATKSSLVAVVAGLLSSQALLGAEVNRQSFLAAVKGRIEAQPALMQSDSRSLRRIAVVKPVSERFRQYLNEPPAESWQRDLIAIPEILPNGEKATFEIALAYLASAETGTPFNSLVRWEIDPSNIIEHRTFVMFLRELLPTMFDENRPCSFPGFYLNNPSEARFANSICTDLKQAVGDARRKYADARMLAAATQARAETASPLQTVPPPSPASSQVPEATMPPEQAPPQPPSNAQPTPQRTEPGRSVQPPISSAPAPRPIPSSNDGWYRLIGGFAVIVLVAVVVYFIPSMVAFSRRHRNRWVIFVINLVFGATLLGWVVALVWALNKVDDPIKGGVKYDPQPSDPVL